MVSLAVYPEMQSLMALDRDRRLLLDHDQALAPAAIRPGAGDVGSVSQPDCRAYRAVGPVRIGSVSPRLASSPMVYGLAYALTGRQSEVPRAPRRRLWPGNSPIANYYRMPMRLSAR